MIDTVKRKTLKRIGLSAAATAAAGLTGHAVASSSAAGLERVEADVILPELADIQVDTRVSSVTNDIEVVVTNRSAQATRITQITPSETSTKRGRFNFDALLAKGDLTLAPGESVTVPMTPHAVVLDASTSAGERAHSLTSALKRSFSVITDNESFARVSIGDKVRYV